MSSAIGWVQALLLGTLQGLTEFLPVSSSGHLVLAQTALGLRESEVLFDILVHVGTLAAVLGYYGKDLWRILRAWLLSLGRGAGLAGGSGDEREAASARTAWLLILGTVPASLVGLLLEDAIDRAFSNPLFVAGALFVTGAILYTSASRPAGERGEGEMTWRDALIIGLFQAAAIFPGVSRSGATIAAALFLGIEREQAARFSFLLAIPAIAGAFVLKGSALTEVSAASLGPFLLGTVAAAAVGFLALGWLLRLVRAGSFGGFAYYCWALAGVVIVVF